MNIVRDMLVLFRISSKFQKKKLKMITFPEVTFFKNAYMDSNRFLCFLSS